MKKAIEIFTGEISKILKDNVLAIYLYGSVVLEDFRLGWSDIDIMCFTKSVMTDEQAEELVMLRQNIMNKENENLYYRSFEGAIVAFDEFKNKDFTKVVYWGTSGQRIIDNYSLDVFSQYELIKYGQLINGQDIREELELPPYQRLKAHVIAHYQTIRKYAVNTGESIYSCGWIFDIARGIYTLRTGDVISKTEAGEWALKEHLFQNESQLQKAIQIRKEPLKYKEIEKEWFASLGPIVQQYADILEKEIEKTC